MVDMSVGILNEAKVQDFGALLHQQVAKDEGSAAANKEAAKWKESDARQEEERRRENRAAWLEHYLALSETYRRRAEFYAYKAERLCRDG